VEPFSREDRFARRYGLVPQEPKIRTTDRARARRSLAAVSWLGRGGAPWRCLPAAYGRWHSLYQRCARRGALGVRARLFPAVADAPDRQRGMVDAAVARAHAGAASAPTHRGIRRPQGAGAPGAAAAPRATSSGMRAATRSRSS
jgi:transposase